MNDTLIQQAPAQAKKKLLFLVTEDWFFVSHRLPIAKQALAEGFDVTVLTRVREHGQDIRRAGIRLIHIPFHRSSLNPLREAIFFIQLVLQYRKLRPDIVHHVGLKPVIFGSLAARLTDTKAVVNALSGMGYLFSSKSLKARLLRPVAAMLLRIALGSKCGGVILQNPDDRALLISARLVSAATINLIRGVGVDPASFPMVAEAKGVCVVVLPARMLADKGVREFVEAARFLKQQGVQARFALVGAPDPENPTTLSIQELEAWQAEGLIEYWGWRKNMAQVFQQSHIVCLPSYREGLPKALLEAAASGRPIVTTDVPGCREVVQNGKNGLLVPARDAVQLGLALRMLIDNADLRTSFGRYGRALVEREFTARSAIAATISTYRRLLGASAASGRRKPAASDLL